MASGDLVGSAARHCPAAVPHPTQPSSWAVPKRCGSSTRDGATNLPTAGTASDEPDVAAASNSAGSVQGERSWDDLARRLVGSDHDSSGGDLGVDEVQSGGDGALREQPFAGPDDKREDP